VVRSSPRIATPMRGRDPTEEGRQGHSQPSGASIHFSPDNPLPASLVKKILRARLKEEASKGR
jgi:hypothetical protein